MNEFEYFKLNSQQYKDFFDKLKDLSFDEYFSNIIPVKIFQEGFFELYITKLEKKNFGLVKPTYELFYSKFKGGAFIKEENSCDICCNEPNLGVLVSGILSNHGILGIIMSAGIQKNSDHVQKGPRL